MIKHGVKVNTRKILYKKNKLCYYTYSCKDFIDLKKKIIIF